MAEKSASASRAVERLYRRDPQATLDEYLVVATRADKSLKGIAKRSFNAIYLLPMKRAASAGKPGRKRKTGRKKASAKATTRRPAKRKVRRGRRVSVSAGGRAAARDLVLGRDRRVVSALGASGDPQQAYALAADIDDFIDELASVLRK